MRDQAYAEAAARRDARLADPYQDEEYATQEADAYAAYYSALDQAGAAWAAAEQAAYDEWQAAMNAAESTYTQTESQAWNQYLERLDELNSQLEHTRLILEAAFQTAWNNFVRDWTEMETEAWDAYQRARTQMLQPPPEGQRRVGPPPLNVTNLLAMQGGGAGQRKEIPESDLGRAIVRDFERLVKTRNERDLHGRVVLDLALRSGRSKKASGIVREGVILDDDIPLGDAWKQVVKNIQDTLSKAKYQNVTVKLQAQVEYECTNPSGSARQMAAANLSYKVKYQIIVNATRAGSNYEKIFEIECKGNVYEQGVQGASYK